MLLLPVMLAIGPSTLLSVASENDSDTLFEEGDSGQGVFVAKIELNEEKIASIRFNGGDVDISDEKYVLWLGEHSITISPTVNLSNAGGKSYVTITEESGEKFTAQLQDDTAKFVFVTKPIDLRTVVIGAEDGVVFLHAGALTAGQSPASRAGTRKREWTNRGYITIGSQFSSAEPNFVAADDGMIGVGSMPPVVWSNKRGGRIDVRGSARIGVPDGITENKGEILIGKGGDCILPGGTRLLNRGRVDIDLGIFSGDIVQSGGLVRILNREPGWQIEEGINGETLSRESDKPSYQARIDLARGSTDEPGGLPGVRSFYVLGEEEEAGHIWGSVLADDGETVLYDGSDESGWISPDALSHGVEVANLTSEKDLSDFGLEDAAFIGHDQRVIIRDRLIPDLTGSQDLRAAFYSIDGYTSYTDDGYGETVPVDQTTEVIQEVSDGTTVHYLNDNSWFNGVFEINSGIAEIAEAGAIPGGDIILRNESSLIWHGGAKDNNNRPTVILHDKSKLTFDLSPGALFSVYGRIESDGPAAEVHFDAGEVYIKEDCSGFVGTVFVANGATFVIRKDKDHRGQMFSGSMQVQGNAVVKTNQGMSPLSLSTGTLTFKKDDLDEEPEAFNIDKLTVGEEAVVFADLEGANINDAVISGKIHVSKNANFSNLDVSGGTIQLMSGVQSVSFAGETIFGSRLVTTDNVIADVTFEALRIRDDHDMFWELDLDPKTNTGDHMSVGEMFFTSGSSLVIDKFKLLNSPTAESHVFEILSILNGGSYPNIRIDATDEVVGTYGTYKLYAEGGPGCVTLRIPNAAFRDATPIQVSTINNSAVPLKNIHQPLLNSAVSFHEYVFDESIGNASIGKYRFWDKTYSGESDLKLPDTKINNAEHGTIFGCDFRGAKLSDSTYVMPTAFFNYSTGRTAYNEDGKSRKGRIAKYMFGVKGSFFTGKTILEAIGSYGFIGSDLRELGIKKSKMHSNIFSVSAKVSRYCDIARRTGLRPEFMVTGSYAINGNYTSESTVIKNKNTLKCTLSPGLFVVSGNGKVTWSVGARCNYEIGKEMKSEFSGDVVEGAKLKRLYGEALC
ncbi:MAG: autotransporter outer membrane beta-barrel domain-containing protein, partial [Holosporales bacterium]|nr:autotransporter outer membrane beta-barrel domain-containing protein [Holosporales bacterium]